MRLINRAWPRLAMMIGVALLLSAHLFVARATPPQAVGDFKVFLPLITQIVPPLRIDSAATAGYTDTSGNLWQADAGYLDGQTGNVGNIAIANTSESRRTAPVYRA